MTTVRSFNQHERLTMSNALEKKSLALIAKWMTPWMELSPLLVVSSLKRFTLAFVFLTFNIILVHHHAKYFAGLTHQSTLIGRERQNSAANISFLF